MGGGGIAVEAARPAPGVPVPGGNRLVRRRGGLVWKLSQAGGVAVFVPGVLLPAGAALRERFPVRRALAPFGLWLGASPVLYAYCEEHGRCLSTNAVGELGRALWGR